jgi:hypothetical protein
MNKERRKRLDDVSKSVSDAWAIAQSAVEKLREVLTASKEELEAVRDEEQDAFEALSENLQNGERGQTMQEKIEHMENALGHIESLDGVLCGVGDAVDEVTSSIEEARS